MAKIQRSYDKKTKQERYWITIPKTKMKIKNWQKGQEVDWSFDKFGNLVLREVSGPCGANPSDIDFESTGCQDGRIELLNKKRGT